MYQIPIIDFDLDHTLDCGQVFRWEKKDDWWTGVVRGSVVSVRQDTGADVLWVNSDLPEGVIRWYFRLDDDLSQILSLINRDQYINAAIAGYRGLRLIRQEPWECLISYMLATASNIPRIKKGIFRLCQIVGDEIEPDYYSFPDAGTLANACEDDISDCKLGFRASRIIKAAGLVAEGELDLDATARLDYPEAKQQLMLVKGIGEKVADCVLLFSFDKMEAFPVDTHVEQVVRSYYGDDEFFGGTVTKKKIGEWGRSYFGNYCGYAQQYLFYGKRLEGIRSDLR
ncbi:MAG: DNA-3-methyladenine glycosylase family protein [Methanosarcinaceae archaeon]